MPAETIAANFTEYRNAWVDKWPDDLSIPGWLDRYIELCWESGVSSVFLRFAIQLAREKQQ